MGREKSSSLSPGIPGLPFDPRSISLRFIGVAVLIGVSMIPLALVSCVVDDRQRYRNVAVEDISAVWGGRQRIAGPILIIPVDGSEGEAGEEHYVAVMPERLDVSVATDHELRRRGIFETPVFGAEITAEGAFAPLDLEQLRDRFGALRPDLAMVAVGVSDPRGIRDAKLVRGDDEVPLSAISSHQGPVSAGLEGGLADGPELGGAFSLKMSLRWTERFSVVPVGDASTVAMLSTWPHPSFDGGLLPDARDITPEGFASSWTTRDLARGFPGVMRVSSTDGDHFEGKDFGFSAFEPVDLYGSVERSIKYGVLFVVLTMVSVLCLELATGIRFHFVQYGVTGVALVLFFLTLLALAEHVGFTLGYIAAALILTGMIGWYAYGSTGNRRLAAASFGSLATLYAVLYTLLRLESFALLVGTLVLLGALAMLMRVTRGLTPTADAGAPA